MRTMKRVGRAWSLLVLGGALLALPAASAQKEGSQKAAAACEDSCADKAAGVMQQCMAKCPDPAVNKGGFTNCARRCSENSEEVSNQCSKGCPKEKPQRSKNRTHQGQNNRSKY